MQPRTLDQIIAELNPTYEPQIQSLRSRQALIPKQIAEEEKGLQAKQETAFGDILGGARRRGLGFSGIPLSEQARYTSTEFLPALARLRQQGKEQAFSLEDAILGISERRNTLAQQLRQQEIDRAEQMRQFNESLAEQQRQRAAASAAAFSPSFDGATSAGGSTQTPSLKDMAYANVQSFLQRGRAAAESDFQATLKSANYGNALDKLKVELYKRAGIGQGATASAGAGRIPTTQGIPRVRRR